MQVVSKYQSPLGELLLAADEIGLTGAWFAGQKFYARRPGAKKSPAGIGEAVTTGKASGYVDFSDFVANFRFSEK